jgi:hypothetical protein
MEHSGLAWVGISGDDGTFRGVLVDPDTKKLKHSVRFVKRSTGGEYLSPHDIKDDEW